MLEAYNNLMKHLAESKVMTKARVKNGFLRKETKGYRDIKVNVIFESETGTKMICEIQLIYGQNLNEKKRSHRYYHLTRERAFYEGVVQSEKVGAELDLKALQFEPVLNFKTDVGLNAEYGGYTKCAVHSDLNFIFTKHLIQSTISCTDLVDNKMSTNSLASRSLKSFHLYLILVHD